MKKIAIILTSTTQMGENGPKTGVHMAELTHALNIFDKNAIEYDFFSTKGGKVTLDAVDKEDEINAEFLSNDAKMNLLESTGEIENANPQTYEGIYFPGGHGPMWDFPDNVHLHKFVKDVYEAGKPIAAVCHGVVGLVNVVLTNGEHLVNGKRINSFTDKEEITVKHDTTVPFLLESKLKEQGAHFYSSEPFSAHMESDQNIITGQNPVSVEEVAEEFLKHLK